MFQSTSFDSITSLLQGLDTRCSSKGLQFSSGWRQRIAIARALIRKPVLLLSDGAMLGLDTHSERVVQEALERALSSRTTITIAHRYNTVRYADVV